MKKIILFLLLLIAVVFPQEIEKTLQFSPYRYYGISINGNISYALSDMGMIVLEENPGYDFRIVKIVDTYPPYPIHSLISGNKLLLECGDSIKYYDISVKTDPQRINSWKIPLAMKKIVKFGNYYILHDNVKYFLVSIDNDSLRVLLDIPNNGKTLAIDYPYLVMTYATSLEFYKISANLEFYLEQTVEETHVRNAVARDGLLSYMRPTYLSVPPAYYYELNVRWRNLTVPGFPIINQKTTANSEVQSIYDASKFHYATIGGYYIWVYSYSGNFLGAYDKKYVVHLDTTNRYFGLGDEFFVNGYRPRIFDNYYALSQKHRIIQHSGNKIYLVKNDDATNTLVKLDSLETADTLSVRDSIIILRNKNSVKVYGIDKNNFFFADSFTISNAVANYDYFGNLLVWYRNTSFEVHRRNGNLYSLLFSKTTLPKANKSFIKDSSLFIVDPNKGVGIYDLRSNYLGQEKWLKTPVTSGISATIAGNILWFIEGGRVIAYNISDLNIPPVALDTLSFYGGYERLYDFIVANSGVYIRGMHTHTLPGYQSLVIKVSLAGDSLINNYMCELPVDTDPYQLTESHKTLIVAGIKNLYWIRDTSIVSGVDYTETGKAEEYSLEQNYPNPFNSETIIFYRIPSEDRVTIKLYDVLGSEVAELTGDTKPAGRHQVRLNSRNLTSGVYFYQIVSGKYTNTKKLLILK
ncbi:MAG: T9SS type A sorting domain-containing protein [Ignavibacteriaceae bacterium]|jgi:hypothetical protein|nr:T9SS type A sorting domain-containing protein [Ignavibacteriaceae bacterium]